MRSIPSPFRHQSRPRKCDARRGKLWGDMTKLSRLRLVRMRPGVSPASWRCCWRRKNVGDGEPGRSSGTVAIQNSSELLGRARQTAATLERQSGHRELSRWRPLVGLPDDVDMIIQTINERALCPAEPARRREQRERGRAPYVIYSPVGLVCRTREADSSPFGRMGQKVLSRRHAGVWAGRRRPALCVLLSIGRLLNGKLARSSRFISGSGWLARLTSGGSRVIPQAGGAFASTSRCQRCCRCHWRRRRRRCRRRRRRRQANRNHLSPLTVQV